MRTGIGRIQCLTSTFDLWPRSIKSGKTMEVKVAAAYAGIYDKDCTSVIQSLLFRHSSRLYVVRAIVMSLPLMVARMRRN
jgi:hypothetical protein